jgi:hypothetical protein
MTWKLVPGVVLDRFRALFHGTTRLEHGVEPLAMGCAMLVTMACSEMRPVRM